MFVVVDRLHCKIIKKTRRKRTKRNFFVLETEQYNQIIINCVTGDLYNMLSVCIF